MSIFVTACAALVLLSGLFYLLPRGGNKGRGDLAGANLQWYRQREEELAQEDDVLREEAQLRLLEDGTLESDDAKEIASGGSFPAWLLLPVVAAMAFVFYYELGGYSDVLIAERLSGLSDATPPNEMEALLADIEVRSGQRPENLHYSALLARYYMGSERFAQAAELYRLMLEEAPEDAQILAFAAQAEFLAAGRKLSDDARLLAEQALAANPHQGTALGLLGMASFEEGKYRAAVAYWERLLVMEQPGSESARLIEDVIAQAKAQIDAGAGGAVAAASPHAAGSPHGAASNQAVAAAAPEVSGPGVTVSVRLPDGGQVNPGDTVFVLARNADGGSRMPLAVQRLRGSQLPLTLRLDDSSSMAGQKMSAVDAVIVAVQVSPDGRPGEDGASWLGEAGPLAPSLEPEPVEIVLAPRQGS